MLAYRHPCRACRFISIEQILFDVYEHGKPNDADYGVAMRWGPGDDEVVHVALGSPVIPKTLTPLAIDALFDGLVALHRLNAVRQRHPGWDAQSHAAARAERRVDAWHERRHKL